MKGKEMREKKWLIIIKQALNRYKQKEKKRE